MQLLLVDALVAAAPSSSQAGPQRPRADVFMCTGGPYASRFLIIDTVNDLPLVAHGLLLFPNLRPGDSDARALRKPPTIGFAMGRRRILRSRFASAASTGVLPSSSRGAYNRRRHSSPVASDRVAPSRRDMRQPISNSAVRCSPSPPLR